MQQALFVLDEEIGFTEKTGNFFHTLSPKIEKICWDEQGFGEFG